MFSSVLLFHLYSLANSSIAKPFLVGLDAIHCKYLTSNRVHATAHPISAFLPFHIKVQKVVAYISNKICVQKACMKYVFLDLLHTTLCIVREHFIANRHKRFLNFCLFLLVKIQAEGACMITESTRDGSQSHESYLPF